MRRRRFLHIQVRQAGRVMQETVASAVPRTSLLRGGISWLSKLHDLWILLAWATILGAIMLNTFYNRSCFDFATARDSTATCQTGLDIGLMALAAIGAGIAFDDERVGYIG